MGELVHRIYLNRKKQANKQGSSLIHHLRISFSSSSLSNSKADILIHHTHIHTHFIFTGCSTSEGGQRLRILLYFIRPVILPKSFYTYVRALIIFFNGEEIMIQ